MKQLTCEMCGSTDLMKQDGVFVCQTCGCKYSVEEAKKMMVEGTVDVSGSKVKVDNTDAIDNYLKLASNALNSGNNQEAETYANKIIEIDPVNCMGWYIKGNAAGWQTTGANNRFNEAVECWGNAIDYVDKDKAFELKDMIFSDGFDIANAIVQMHCNSFANYPSDDNMQDIKSNISSVVNNFIELHKKFVVRLIEIEKIDTDGVPEVAKELESKLKEFGTVFAQNINDAAVSAWNNKIVVDYENDNGNYPSDFAFKNLLTFGDNCIDLLEFAIGLPNINEENNIVRCNNVIGIQNYLIKSCSYSYETVCHKGGWLNDYVDTYSNEYVKSLSLTDNAVATRKKAIKQYEDKIANIKREIQKKVEEEKRKAEKEKKKKIAEYWAEHKEEKQALEAERDSLKAQIKEIENSQYAKVAEISEEKKNIPGNEEIENYNAMIEKLSIELSGLGLFKGKEKKILQEKINELNTKIDALKLKMKDEENAIQKRIDVERVRARDKIQPLQRRIDIINNELTKTR